MATAEHHQSDHDVDQFPDLDLAHADSTWASTGLVSVKSSVPSRTSSMNRARLGWTTSWVIPATRV